MAATEVIDLAKKRDELAAKALEKQGSIKPLPSTKDELLDYKKLVGFENAEVLEKNEKNFDRMALILESILTSATLEMHYWHERAPDPDRIYVIVERTLEALQSPDFVGKHADLIAKMSTDVRAAMAACEKEAQNSREAEEAVVEKKPSFLSSLVSLLYRPEEPEKSDGLRSPYAQTCLKIRTALFELSHALDDRLIRRKATS